MSKQAVDNLASVAIGALTSAGVGSLILQGLGALVLGILGAIGGWLAKEYIIPAVKTLVTKYKNDKSRKSVEKD